MTKARVLAVDDDPINIRIIEAIFEESDIELFVTEDGQRALEILESSNPPIDVVLLDRMMPKLDGLEVLQRIKENPALADTPVVMQTAAASPEQVAEGLRAGAHYYLTKPYTPEALQIIVREALSVRELQRHLEDRTKRLNAAARCLRTGSFALRTLEEAAELASLLAAQCPAPVPAANGLIELLVNAIEHGNLEISYDEKSRLKRDARWESEVERRLALPANAHKRVIVSFERNADSVQFRIRDEGKGFPWKRYLDFDPSRAFDPNGRGIAMARALSFTQLEYVGAGNEVIATIAFPANTARSRTGAVPLRM